MSLSSGFECLPKKKIFIIGSCLMSVATLLYFTTSFEIQYSSLFLVAFFCMILGIKKKIRISFALVTALVSFVFHLQGKPETLKLEYFLWNNLMDFILYIGIPLLLSRYIEVMESQANLAKIDSLTGLLNRNSFYELAERELQRSLRYRDVFSVAYIDCDNFKTVNDTLGHATGDKLLKSVADILKNNLHTTDVIARLGGDEFVILFPKTDQVVCDILAKIEYRLLKEMDKNDWAVTFSIGLATYHTVPKSVDEVILKADGLMYAIKHSGKDGLKAGVF